MYLCSQGTDITGTLHSGIKKEMDFVGLTLFESLTQNTVELGYNYI